MPPLDIKEILSILSDSAKLKNAGILDATNPAQMRAMLTKDPDVDMRVMIHGNTNAALRTFTELKPIETITALNFAIELLHSSFLESENGKNVSAADRNEAISLRSRVLELYGHPLIHYISNMRAEAEEATSAESVGLLRDVLLAVSRTLKSPIDDADKIAHMREGFTPAIQEALEKLLG